jgi:hypothetical protein
VSGGVFFLFFIAFAVLVGFLAYRSYQQSKKRTEALMTWATQNGWQFAVEDDSWCQRWNGAPFHEGDHRRARNVIIGQANGRPFAAFDYSYQTHSSNGQGGSSTTTHHYFVFSLAMPTALPMLQVTPESMFSRLGNAFGLTDIELESEDFNRAYRVSSNDPKFASDVLTPRTMEQLLVEPHLSWRIEGVDVMSWQNGTLTPQACSVVQSRLATVIAGIPDFVWKDHGVDPGTATVGGSQ